MDDREAPGESDRAARHRLRIRTVAVSFAAAVMSAHQDLDTTPGERDALVEVWRAWSLETLEGYRADIAGADPAVPRSERTALLEELDAAIDAVRRR